MFLHVYTCFFKAKKWSPDFWGIFKQIEKRRPPRHDQRSRGAKELALPPFAFRAHPDKTSSFADLFATNNEAEGHGCLLACLAAQKFQSDEVVIRGDSQLVVRALNDEVALNDRKLVNLVSPCRRVIEEMTLSGRKVTVEHVPRDDNQPSDGLANEAMNGKLHIEEPQLQVVPSAVATVSSNFEVCSNSPLPDILEQTPPPDILERRPPRQRRIPASLREPLDTGLPLASKDHPAWSFLRMSVRVRILL